MARRTLPAPAADTVPPGARPVGRPPRISRETIAQAALDIGLADVSLRAVADRLGVSVAGLYHHIGGKDDLLRLTAEHTARELTLPVDRGQPWPLWLAEWGRYNRNAFVNEPLLLGQYLTGGISVDVIAESTNDVLGPLVREGFTIVEAGDAYEAIASCALGSAVKAIRHGRLLSDHPGPPTLDRDEVFARRRAGELPELRALAAARGGDPFDPTDEFESSLRLILVALAVERGEDPDAVKHLLDRS